MEKLHVEIKLPNAGELVVERSVVHRDSVWIYHRRPRHITGLMGHLPREEAEKLYQALGEALFPEPEEPAADAVNNFYFSVTNYFGDPPA